MKSCSNLKNVIQISFNHIQDGSIRRYSRIGKGQKGPLPKNLSNISSHETWYSYTLPKEHSENIYTSRDTPLVIY